MARLSDIVKKGHRFAEDFKCPVPRECAAFAADLFTRMARMADIEIAVRSSTWSEGSPIPVRFRHDNTEQMFEIEQAKYIPPDVFLEVVNNLLVRAGVSHRLRLISKDYSQWIARLESTQVAALEAAGFRVHSDQTPTATVWSV